MAEVLDAVGAPDLVLGGIAGHAGEVAGEPVELPSAEGIQEFITDDIGTIGLVDEPAEGGPFGLVWKRC